MPGVVHEHESTEEELLGIEGNPLLDSNFCQEKDPNARKEALIKPSDSAVINSETNKQIVFNMPPEQGLENEVQMDITNLCNSNGTQPTIDVENNTTSDTKKIKISNGVHKVSDTDSGEKEGSLQNGVKAKSSKENGVIRISSDIRNYFVKYDSNKRPSDSGFDLAAKKPHLEKEEKFQGPDPPMSNGCNGPQTDELTQKIIADINESLLNGDFSEGADFIKTVISSSEVATSQNGTAAGRTLSDVDLKERCKKRTAKIFLTRLEETEHFNEALKKDLEEFKVKKEWEGQDWEVEEILDYSWCKLTAQGLYQVSWVGWAGTLTWEPLENLETCQEALKNFYAKRLEEREAAQPWRKRLLEVPPDPRTGFERKTELANKFCPPPCQSEVELFFMQVQKKPIKMWTEQMFIDALERLAKSKKPNEKLRQHIKDQIMLRHVRDKRRDQLQRLKDWEVEINADSAETALIKVENDFDLEGPPRHMTYINQYMPSPGIIIPDDPPLGCECEEGACGLSTEKTCCPSMNGQLFPYTKYGKLRVNVGTPIFECNKRCKCGPKCSNRVVQKGRKVKMSIYRTSNGCGWGVKTLENIKKGSFVVEYVGEVITSDEAEQRGKKYDAEGKTYLFDLDFNLGNENLYTVDAALYGNVAHFINHSCEPNLAIYNVWIDCLDPNLPRLCFFANRDIARGEEITFDYKQQTGPEAISLEDYADPESGTSRAECRCGAPKCRKIIF